MLNSLIPQRSRVAFVTVVVTLLLLAAPEGSHAFAADRAPDIEATEINSGATVSLDQYEGKVVLLNIWATWCIPCREEMPELQALHDEFGGQGLEIIGVSIDRDGRESAVREFRDEMGVEFTILHDPDNDVSRAFQTTGVPETFLIDRTGAIVYNWKGALEEGSPHVRKTIQATLDGRAVEDGAGGIATVGLTVAFAAGVLSLLSPCVFPLLPTYATYITGISVDERVKVTDPSLRASHRWIALRYGLLFVLGFSVVFIALGASASAVGELLQSWRVWLARTGGILLIVMGLHMVGVIRIPLLDRVTRPSVSARKSGTRSLTTFLVGMAFGAGWTPCIGPVLAGILTMAAASATMSQGVLLLAVYSAGLAVPFLLSTVLIDQFMAHRPAIGPWLPKLERVSAMLIFGIGVLMALGAFNRLAEITARWEWLV